MSRCDRLLHVEALEDRTVPALFGTPWPNADHLTVSFAPDGTDVAGAQSNLFDTLDAALPTATWQQDILRAFQTWASKGNVNVGVVTDNGAAFGTAGPAQGSGSYGDVRVSARPLSDNVLALSTPFDVFNTWAGEVVLNSNKLFSHGNAAGKYDLYTVLLQESGHVLGMDNSPDPASVMYENYGTARTGLSAGDITGIQKLYGVRTADRFDLNGNNNTSSAPDAITFVTNAATQLGSTDGTSGDKPFVVAGSLHTATDVDYYSVKTPVGSNAFTVALQTDGISLLKAKVSVYNSAGALVQSAVATPPGNGQPFVLTVTGAQADATYRVRVKAAETGAFGVGAYELAVGAAGQAQAAVLKTVPPTFASSFFGTDLGTVRTATDARWDYFGQGSISNQYDNDFYTVRTKSDTPPVLLVTAGATAGSKLNPLVEVYDSSFHRVSAEVLVNNRSKYTFQIENVQKNATYYIRVRAANAADATANSGDYVMAADFRATKIVPPTFATGTLQGATNQAFTSFQVTRTQSVYFEVTGTGSATAAVRMTVYDANNVAVLSLLSKSGETTGGNVLLGQGTYTVRFVAGNQNGTPLAAFQFRGRYTLGSDPIGPELIDPTDTPPTAEAPVVAKVYTYDPLTDLTTVFLSPSDVFTSPVGTSSTDPLVWVAAPPTDAFFLSVWDDIYSTVWW